MLQLKFEKGFMVRVTYLTKTPNRCVYLNQLSKLQKIIKPINQSTLAPTTGVDQ